MSEKTDIKNYDQAEAFCLSSIDKLGILLNCDATAGALNRYVIKLIENGATEKDDIRYNICTIDDLGQTPFQEVDLEYVSLIIEEKANYVNYGRCYNIGNGKKSIYHKE